MTCKHARDAYAVQLLAPDRRIRCYGCRVVVRDWVIVRERGMVRERGVVGERGVVNSEGCGVVVRDWIAVGVGVQLRVGSLGLA